MAHKSASLRNGALSSVLVFCSLHKNGRGRNLHFSRGEPGDEARQCFASWLADLYYWLLNINIAWTSGPEMRHSGSRFIYPPCMRVAAQISLHHPGFVTTPCSSRAPIRMPSSLARAHINIVSLIKLHEYTVPVEFMV